MNLGVLFDEVAGIDEEYAAKIAELQQERDKLVYKKVGNVKSQMEAYIADTSVPLIDRFNLWCKAPNDIVGSLSFVPTFKNENLRQKFFEASEFNRGDEIDVRDILSDYICEETGQFSCEEVYSEPEFNDKEIEELVEEFLALNIGIFNFDW